MNIGRSNNETDAALRSLCSFFIVCFSSFSLAFIFFSFLLLSILRFLRADLGELLEQVRELRRDADLLAAVQRLRHGPAAAPRGVVKAREDHRRTN